MNRPLDEQKNGRTCVEWGARRGSHLLGLTVYELAREWRRRIDARLKGIGLSDSRWRVLKTVEFLGSTASQKEIAETIGVESPTLVRALDQLEKDGWVQRHVSEEDRRVKVVELLPKANKLLERITSACLEVQAEVLDDFPEDALLCCHETLLAIRDRLAKLNGKQD
ncbi:MAG: MarR family transcriptional regulator [Desulfovibrionaceae bacterium]